MLTNWFEGAVRNLRALVRDTEGGVATYFVLLMPIMVAVAGMSVDTATWYTHKRGMQSAADAAAMGGAYEKVRQTDPDQIEIAGRRDAALNGAVDIDLGGTDTVIVNHPPKFGERKDSGDSVEAIVTRQVDTLFSSIVFQGPITMSARAVAIADVSDTCMWALDPDGTGITASGGADTHFNCGLQSNSDISTNGGACIETTKIKVTGDATGGCITSDVTLTNVPPAVDPFSALKEPTWASCTQNGPLKINSMVDGSGDEIQQDVYPGVYCGAVTITGWANFTDDQADNYNGAEPGSDGLTYGLYILDTAGFTMNNATAKLTGTNITFFLSAGSGTADNINITSGVIDLSAAEDGPYVGILFWQSPNTTGNITHTFTGKATMFLTGILYFPNQDVKFAGGAGIADATASLLIAKTVDFVGASYLAGFEGVPIKANPLLVKATIVE